MSTGNSGKNHHHITPLKIYYGVWFALVVFTVITVATSYVDLGGSWNILVAMLIATTKALLVMLFFMGLKYEGQENNVTFFASFIFLAIFILLTASDLWFRDNLEAAKIDTSEYPPQTSSVDVKAVLSPTPELLTKGKTLFSQQCMTCHGVEGKGDGPAAASLNPKPRNLMLQDGWKNGRTLAKVYKTLTEGIPGTPMPSFSSLGAEDRFALAHFVRSLMGNAPQDSKEELAALSSQAGGKPSPKLPLSLAMKRLEEPEPSKGAASEPVQSNTRGAVLYKQYCMSCHGVSGEGRISVQVAGLNPPLTLKSRSFSQSKLDKAQFIRVVSEGMPGRGMPGFAQFSAAEWASLHQYVQMLSR